MSGGEVELAGALVATVILPEPEESEEQED